MGDVLISVVWLVTYGSAGTNASPDRTGTIAAEATAVKTAWVRLNDFA